MLLTAIIFVPTMVALLLAFMPKSVGDQAFRLITLAATIVTFVMTCALLTPFDKALGAVQGTFLYPWISSKAFRIDYLLGLDGISLPLIVLTSFVTALSMGASWSITKQVKGYCILFLLLETGMLGVFLSLDFFLFYIFWEVMLLPMYFLIGIWGGPRKEYAAIKFFLYTLLGSVLMLIAILMLYFASDLNSLSVADLQSAHVHAGLDGRRISVSVSTKNALDSGEVSEELSVAFEKELAPLTDKATVAVEDNGLKWRISDGEKRFVVEKATDEELTIYDVSVFQAALDDLHYTGTVTPGSKSHTFNLMALAKMGQTTDLFGGQLLFGWTLQHWAFLLLFIGFAVKVPSVPIHTWLPDAHVEAPTPISMILAGVLLKMGGYGILRICYPLCPQAGFDFRWFVCAVGAVSMVYGAFAALAQKDFKRMVAYSSVSHMGYVVLGLGVWSAYAANGNVFDWYYWDMGIKGAMYQMVAHGISSAGMFFMVGVVYDRVHHRDLDKFGGLYGKMPLYTGLAIVLFFAGLGLPGLCGFIGEVFVVLSVWNFSKLLAIISAAVVVLTAAYILWALQRVYLGAEYKGPHPEALTPITLREASIASVLVAFAIVFGVYPKSVLQYMDATIDQQVISLAKSVDYPEPVLGDEATVDVAVRRSGSRPDLRAISAPGSVAELRVEVAAEVVPVP